MLTRRRMAALTIGILLTAAAVPALAKKDGGKDGGDKGDHGSHGGKGSDTGPGVGGGGSGNDGKGRH